MLSGEEFDAATGADREADFVVTLRRKSRQTDRAGQERARASRAHLAQAADLKMIDVTRQRVCDGSKRMAV